MTLHFHKSEGIVFGLLLILSVLFQPVLFAQAESPTEGTVTNSNGTPLPDVFVYGSESKGCCPVKRESTKTDNQGRFHLENPGAVVHFSAEKYQPQAFVMTAKSAEIHISLELSKNDLTVPACQTPKAGKKRIGWGKLGLQFDAPLRDVKVYFGKTDTDYVKHVVESKNSKARMAFWFGPMAIGLEPDDDLFLKSIKFAQRHVVNPQGKTIGLDSWGELSGGMRWRQTVIATEGGPVYRDVAPETADIFDQIINSVCKIQVQY